MKRKPTLPRQGHQTVNLPGRVALHLVGLPNLDGLFLSARFLSASHQCSDLCNPIFHTEVDGPGRPWQELEPTARLLYRQYGRLLEPDHNGEFVAVVATGQTVIAANLRDVVIKALAASPDNACVMASFFIFRIGQRSLGQDGGADTP